MGDFEKEFDDILGDIIDKSDSVQYVCFVMDHSGSMGTMAGKSKRNYNEQLETIRDESVKNSIQTVVFNVEFDDTVYSDNGALIDKMKPMQDYWIGGSTALHDAIAHGIGLVKRTMSKDPRSDKAALILVQTDGWENASREFAGAGGRKKINDMIKELEETGDWTFTFLAEGIDKEIGMDLGFVSTMAYSKSAEGLKTSLNATRGGLKSFYAARATGKKSVKNFYDDGGGTNGDRT